MMLQKSNGLEYLKENKKLQAYQPSVKLYCRNIKKIQFKEHVKEVIQRKLEI